MWCHFYGSFSDVDGRTQGFSDQGAGVPEREEDRHREKERYGMAIR